MNEISTQAQSALEALEGIRGAKKHRRIWKHLIIGRFMEAISLTQHLSFAVSTASGVIATLSQLYFDKPKSNNKTKVRYLVSYCRELIQEAETGRNVRLELEELAESLDLGPVDLTIQVKPTVKQQAKAKRLNKKALKERDKGNDQGNDKGIEQGNDQDSDESTCGTVHRAHTTHARGTAPAPAVLLAPARDPWFKSSALAQRAQQLSAELPPPQVPDGYRGRESVGLAKGDERATWIYYIDQVQRRWPAPLTASDLHRITGAPVRWCYALLEEWKALLARGISEDQRRSLALSLSAEAEAIAREALALVSGSEDERVKAGALKLALDALGRRQSLAGLDKITLEAKIEQKTTDWTEQAAAAGLSADELRQIGDITSRALSRKTEK